MAQFGTALESMTPEFQAGITFTGILASGPNFFHVDATPYPRLCDRFGGPSPGDFLAKWRYTSNGKWRYPVENGFLLDVYGLPIMGNLSLAVGTTVDRLGVSRVRVIGRKISIIPNPRFFRFDKSKKRILCQCRRCSLRTACTTSLESGALSE